MSFRTEAPHLTFSDEIIMLCPAQLIIALALALALASGLI